MKERLTSRRDLNKILALNDFFELVQQFIRKFGRQNSEIAREAVSGFSPGEAKIIQELITRLNKACLNQKFWTVNSEIFFLNIFKIISKAAGLNKYFLSDQTREQVIMLVIAYFALRVLTEKEIRNIAGINPRNIYLKKYLVNKIKLNIHTNKTSSFIANAVIQEIEADLYGLKKIKFHKNDVVVDIGGYIGVWAIYLAKKYPFIKIYSFEPVPQNFRLFQRNIKSNRVKNIRVFNLAVTHDKKPTKIFFDPFENSSASRFPSKSELKSYPVKSTTLDEILQKQGIKKCKLLKIDCEGSEYEILYGCRNLMRVQYLSGEFHLNKKLTAAGHSLEKLMTHCKTFIPEKRIVVTRTLIAD